MKEPVLLHDAPNTIKKVTHVWAILSEDVGGEVLCGGPMLGPGTLVPMVTASEKVLPGMIRIARAIAVASNKKIKLVKFTGREDISDIGELDA